jgi:hypothetical protein
MTRFVSKHYRTPVLVCLAGLFTMICLFAIERVALTSDPAAAGLTRCSADFRGTCSTSLSEFASRFSVLSGPGIEWMLVLPVLVGMFLGAPLVARELETGTYRFLWTQGITRLRWFVGVASALILVVATVFAIGGVFANWGLDPLLQAQDLTLLGSRLASPAYDVLGILPAAFAMFATATGILVGAISRRTLAAMLLTVLIFAGIRVPVALFVRPILAAPVMAVADPNVTDRLPMAVPSGSLIVDTGLVDQQGNVIRMLPSCGPTVTTDKQLQDCYKQRGYRSFVTYEPPSRLDRMQLVEGGLFAAAAVALLAIAGWVIRFRIS